MDNGASSYRRFLDGDREGIAEIIREYRDGLILFLNGFTQNIAAAEELAEETFIRLVVKKPKYSEKSSFKTWLYTIGRNIAIDFLRHRTRYQVDSLEEIPDPEAEQDSLEKAYIRTENKIALYRAMNRLKPEYSQILYLIYLEGLSNAEAAEVLKKKKHQIENLSYRAKISLKSELIKEGFSYEEL